jgi:beta-lactamase regulating signal transducer with metallopeptidase domain
MILPMLLDSAMRSLLLGTVVWGSLKFARLYDTRTETAIWTAVLIAALSMPLLSRHVPSLVLTLPHLAASIPQSVTALGLPGVHAASPLQGVDSWHPLAWLARHGQTSLMAAYALGLFVCAIRIVAGLVLTLRLYRRAVPVHADWARARNVRTSVEITSPVSFVGAILLPADYGEWSAAKRDAVLAHEEAHIARGDFYVQLAALVHCALFWFSPFAWWLQAKLSEIAETASDEAAILRLNDRATYAEILIDVSRLAQKAPLMVGIAKGCLIQQRVEHILSEAPQQTLSLPVRVSSVAALAAFALAVAGAKAVLSPVAAAEVAPQIAADARRPEPSPHQRDLASMPSPKIHAPHAVRPGPEAASAAGNRDDHGYNPRALLDPEYAPKLNYVPTSTVIHAGKEFYIRSTESPVADVTFTYQLDRQRPR